MRNSTSPLAAPISGAGSSGGASHVGPANAIDDEQRENDQLVEDPMGARMEVAPEMKRQDLTPQGVHNSE